jgi:hypothetical protein
MVATAIILPAGLNAPITLQHLVMQLAASGHLDFVSQHLQSLFSELPAPPLMAFMQSVMSMPAIAMLVSPDALVVGAAGSCVAANAAALGASVSEIVIRIARMVRTSFKRGCTSKTPS